MTKPNDSISPAVATNIFDVNSLAALKRQARSGDPAANKVVARQFEALFLQMVLKSMRDATPREGMFDSDQTRMYESLLDQQLGQALGGGGRGTGLAAMIEAQLARQNQEPQAFDGPLPLRSAPPAYRLPLDQVLPLRRDVAPGFMPLRNPPPAPSGTVSPAPTLAPDAATAAQRAFVDRLLPAATAAERGTGIPAHFMVAQAALETGWGKSEPRRADGGPSFNIFGIKAGGGWQASRRHSALRRSARRAGRLKRLQAAILCRQASSGTALNGRLTRGARRYHGLFLLITNGKFCYSGSIAEQP
jgi:flagellar protein FlgJ